MSDKTLDSKIKKGLLEYFVLKIIEKGEIYSSDILIELEGIGITTPEGTIYPLLNKMAKDGKLSHRWEESVGGPPRKYYSLSDYGKGYLEEYHSSLMGMIEKVNFLNK